MKTFNSSGTERGGALSVTTGSLIAETELASGTLSSPAATIDLTSISGSYDDLILRIWARSDRGSGAVSDNIGVRFNNDSTLSNYRVDTIDAADASLAIASGQPADDDDLGSVMPAAASTANLFGYIEVLIPQYAGSKRKLAFSRGGRRQSDSGAINIQIAHLAWENTAAITRVTAYSTTSSNFDTGTHYQLVGRKATTVVTAVS